MHVCDSCFFSVCNPSVCIVPPVLQCGFGFGLLRLSQNITICWWHVWGLLHDPAGLSCLLNINLTGLRHVRPYHCVVQRCFKESWIGKSLQQVVVKEERLIPLYSLESYLESGRCLGMYLPSVLPWNMKLCLYCSVTFHSMILISNLALVPHSQLHPNLKISLASKHSANSDTKFNFFKLLV